MSEHPWKYQDPNNSPSRKGLLLSNEIDTFCRVGLLIRLADYKPENLRAASYTLTVGPNYVGSNGRINKMVKEDQDSFYMEPNSIVYVSTAEELNLPFYVAARFNLRVNWVYKGILLGTGPQVDPGFKGHLSCPLFNLTDRSIKITLGDLFATIDFERTSDFCDNRPWEEIRAGFKEGPEQDEMTFNGTKYLMFKQKPMEPLRKLPSYDIVSSLVELSREVKTWRAIGIAVVVAFISLALTILNFQSNLYRDNRTFSQQLIDLREKVAVHDKKLSETPAPAVGAQEPPRQEPSEIKSYGKTKKKD